MKLRNGTIVRLRDALLLSGRRPSVVMSTAYETLTRQGMLSPEETAALQRVDPIAETMFLMMAADGKIEESEKDAVRGAIRGLTDNLIRSGTINVMMENYAKELDAHGRDERLREIAEALAEDPSDAEAAFSLAAAVAMADDDIADAENDLINQLADWFDIPEDRSSAILDQLQGDPEE